MRFGGAVIGFKAYRQISLFLHAESPICHICEFALKLNYYCLAFGYAVAIHLILKLSNLKPIQKNSKMNSTSSSPYPFQSGKDYQLYCVCLRQEKFHASHFPELGSRLNKCTCRSICFSHLLIPLLIPIYLLFASAAFSF